jgi:hypothetical protein
MNSQGYAGIDFEKCPQGQQASVCLWRYSRTDHAYNNNNNNNKLATQKG